MLGLCSCFGDVEDGLMRKQPDRVALLEQILNKNNVNSIASLHIYVRRLKHAQS